MAYLYLYFFCNTLLHAPCCNVERVLRRLPSLSMHVALLAATVSLCSRITATLQSARPTPGKYCKQFLRYWNLELASALPSGHFTPCFYSNVI